MKRLVSILHKALKLNFTIFVVPHTSTKPAKKTFTLSFLLFLLFTWTGITIWATYISGKHIDYLQLKLDRELIKFKLLFFATELKKSQDLLVQVKEKDEQLRNLLDMKSEKAIITSKPSGKGGPNPEEHAYLQKYLEKKIHEVSLKSIYHQTKTLQDETVKTLASIEEINGFITSRQILYKATPNRWPCTGAITSGFGFRIHPITGRYESHTGIDISNKKGTNIYTTANGKITYTGWATGYGKSIIIDHGYGYGTCYAHLSKILGKKGQKVKRGEIIGLMGETGTTTGVHLHYEVWLNKRTINPKPFLDSNYFFKTARGHRKNVR